MLLYCRLGIRIVRLMREREKQAVTETQHRIVRNLRMWGAHCYRQTQVRPCASALRHRKDDLDAVFRGAAPMDFLYATVSTIRTGGRHAACDHHASADACLPIRGVLSESATGHRPNVDDSSTELARYVAEWCRQRTCRATLLDSSPLASV